MIPDYARQLARLEARARYEPRVHSRPADKLLPLRGLLERLGHPERGPRIVHVAGTNGKGTTSAMAARLLQRNGARVGLYTSPHLVDIRERIQVQGVPVGREGFAAATAMVLDTAERLAQENMLSYFDLLTAIGFVTFREQGVEWLVLETGLGGAADSTNVTEKELAILTPIGHDHMGVLGADLRAIAGQKMGIVPPGVPVVLAAQPPEIADWMAETLTARGNAVWPPSRIALEASPGLEEGVGIAWPGVAPVRLSLPPEHRTRPHLTCAAAALTALDRLIGAPKDDAERIARARTALETALPGRQQWIRGATLGQPPHRPLPSLVLDGGHNREALFALGESLEGWGVRGYTLLVALLEDKMTGPVREPLAALIAGAAEVIGVTLPFPRAPEPAMLRAFLEGLRSPPADGSVRGLVRVTDPSSALALIAETPERPAVATGSLWMVGELLKVLRWPEGAAQPMPACAEVPTAGTEPGLTSGHPPSAQGSP